jgi:hypothetical protein
MHTHTHTQTHRERNPTPSDWAVCWVLQGVLRSLTLGTRAVLGSTSGVLEPYEETAIGSCEAGVAAAQWFTGFLFMQYHVYLEYRMRQRFLAERSQRSPLGPGNVAFLSWPFGSRSGVLSLVIAYAAPIIIFATAWQTWLIMLHWLVQEWHVEGHTPNVLLRLPYAFSSKAL